MYHYHYYYYCCPNCLLLHCVDETRPVKQTDIPWRLKQMLDILVYEEKQQEVEETGACMEYLLQHKILETLCTLGKAQYPPGMSQQVLLFFSKVLTQIQKPVLHIINVYRPVQKLIRLCGLPNSQTEKEEAQFLFAVCSRVKKDPYVLNYILEVCDLIVLYNSKTLTLSMPLEAFELLLSHLYCPFVPITALLYDKVFMLSAVQRVEQCVLFVMSVFQMSRVALRAMESMLLLTSIPEEETANLLAEETPLCALLAQRLCELYSTIPTTLHPADLHTPPEKNDVCSFPCLDSSPDCLEESPSFPAQEHVDKFFSWLDYCDQLIKEATKVLAVKLAKSIHQQWLIGFLQPQLLQMSEVGVLVHTALLSCSVRHIRSPALLQELVHFLLGSETHHEQRAEIPPHKHTLRYSLIEHCDHISDEISVTTLRLFEELLKKPDRNILTNLVLRNLESRCYRLPGSGEERPGADLDLEESECDPFFTDNEFSGSEPLLSLSSHRDERKSSSRTQIAETVNSFLCLVPQEAKTTQHVQGAGYDTYVHDALKSLKECSAMSSDWGWPDTPKPLDVHFISADFYEGHFLKVLFDRVARILEQPYELNLQVTSVLSRLAVFPHPHLHEYLLDPYINLSPGARSLFSMLVRVIGELMQRIQHFPNFTQRLIMVRRQLMGLEAETMMDHATLLKGVIVLEEFCKELAAIAFVKLPVGDHEHLTAFSP
uniref:FHF complex subunit HOOK-interacting protein C-terminal domain-containing protein n=1 Tax=Pygocentrus nattereri TaxID=42514 RepID=A0AAR2JK00_PYGNA